MKPTYYKLTLAFGLFSCDNQANQKMVETTTVDTSQIVSADKKNKQDIYIKDKSLYDQTFIDGLADYNEPLKLIDNYLLTGKDTTFFPNDLPVNKKITFQGAKDNHNFVLTVTRINLTNIIYNFKRTDKDNQSVDSTSGKATLGSMFFLASEMDEDSQTGDGYGSSEYWDKTNNCWFSIRIGIGLDDNGKQRAVVTYGCEDKNKQTLDLDECPTLRTE